jgi:hypothetical protein
MTTATRHVQTAGPSLGSRLGVRQLTGLARGTVPWSNPARPCFHRALRKND